MHSYIIQQQPIINDYNICHFILRLACVNILTNFNESDVLQNHRKLLRHDYKTRLHINKKNNFFSLTELKTATAYKEHIKQKLKPVINFYSKLIYHKWMYFLYFFKLYLVCYILHLPSWICLDNFKKCFVFHPILQELCFTIS